MRQRFVVGLVAFAGCLPAPAVPVGNALWRVKCGTLRARVVNANAETIGVELTLIGDESTPGKSVAAIDPTCGLPLSKAKLRVDTDGDGELETVTAIVEPMEVAGNETERQLVVFDVSEPSPTPDETQTVSAEPDDEDVVELILLRALAPPLVHVLELPTQGD